MSPNEVQRAAGRMGIGVFLSRIMGLVREQAFAILFGASHAMDAFNVAFRIPNLLRDLFAEGAMSSALVPTFVRVRTQEGARRSWLVAGRVFRVLLVITSFLALLGVVFAENLVTWYAADFKKIPGKFELTVELTRWMFPFFPLVVLAAAYMAILNASGRFFWPAFASALFNITSVGTGVLFTFLAKSLGFEPILGMALGVVLGGAVQAFSQRPSLKQVGYFFPSKNPEDPSWNRDPALKSMLMLILPGTLGLAATQINILVNTILATSQEPGAVSWLNYAFRLMQFPIGIFGVAMGVATLPKISELWSQKKEAEIPAALSQSIFGVLVLNLPAAIGLGVLAGPLIELLFEYGRFGSHDTLQTAKALAFYSAGLPFYSLVKVLVPACYAVGKVRLAVVSSLLSVATNILLNLILIEKMGFLGLAFGTAITATLNSVILWWGLGRLLRPKGLSIRVFRLVLASSIMGAAVGAIMNTLPIVSSETLWGLIGFRFLKVSLGVSLGITAYFFLCRWLQLSEATEILSMGWEKLKKKLA